MGKRKVQESPEEVIDVESESPQKAKKQKKHKKHKRKHSHGDVDDNTPKAAIKLKIKLGGTTLASKSVDTSAIKASEEQSSSPWEDETEPAFITKKKDADTSDEEQEWLEALEKGNLDDYGKVKKNKDPKLLTARQRALIHGPSDTLLELPSGYKTVELTEEQIQKRRQRADKRREQAQEKREKAKKQTVDRLLKKQDTKLKGVSKPKVPRKHGLPHVRYTTNQTSASISLPSSLQFPLEAQPPREPPKPRDNCSVANCKNLKKYSCSKTGVPLCSLECYKKNKELHPQAFVTVT